MSGIVGTVTLAGKLPCHLINRLIVPQSVVSTPWVIGIRTTDKQLIVISFGKNSDIVIAIVHGFSLQKASFSVSILRIPRNPHFFIFC